jgi:hypothetical protein
VNRKLFLDLEMEHVHFRMRHVASISDVERTPTTFNSYDDLQTAKFAHVANLQTRGFLLCIPEVLTMVMW